MSAASAAGSGIRSKKASASSDATCSRLRCTAAATSGIRYGRPRSKSVSALSARRARPGSVDAKNSARSHAHQPAVIALFGVGCEAAEQGGELLHILTLAAGREFAQLCLYARPPLLLVRQQHLERRARDGEGLALGARHVDRH
eukprot:3648209-Prymnesium_polylepis.1